MKGGDFSETGVLGVLMAGDENRVSADAKAIMAFEARKKSVGIAYLIWFFLGGVGGHRFYAGKVRSGAIMLTLWLLSLLLTFFVVGWFGFIVLGIWWVIDAFLLHGIIARHNESVMQSAVLEASQPLPQ